MHTETTSFRNAIYLNTNNFDFGMTQFSRRELKVLLLIDGKRSVTEIAELLNSDTTVLIQDFAKLVQLGLIQTEGTIISASTADLVYSESEKAPVEFTLARLPRLAAA